MTPREEEVFLTLLRIACESVFDRLTRYYAEHPEEKPSTWRAVREVFVKMVEWEMPEEWRQDTRATFTEMDAKQGGWRVRWP